MTSEEKRKLRQFEVKVQQLITQYQLLQNENARLQQIIKEKDGSIADLSTKLNHCQKDYNNLKTAKMMVISDGDLQGARQHITRLVREINKCIGLLNKDEVTIDDE